MGIRKFNVMDLSKASLIKPEQLGYKDSLEIIKDESYKIQKSFVKIGWYLKHIRDNKLYSEGGYANIWECAADQLGYSQPTASRFINICEKFSKDHNSPELDDKYAGFDKSQMIEMLPMEQEQLDRVSPDMTVKQIRDIKIENKNPDKKADQETDDNIPGQTSIETDFPEYMPEEDLKEDMMDVYATSHKEENSATSEKNSNESKRKPDLRGLTDNPYCKSCGTPLREYEEKCSVCGQLQDWEGYDQDIDPDAEEIIDGDYREIEVSDPEKENIATSQPEEMQQEEKLSPYGLPKTVYPEGSMIATEGCGHLHNCFSCAQDCAIRQKDRYCNEAPMGNPFPCTTMHILENIRSEIGEQCQFINLDMAKHTAGSHESDPCCKDCNNGSCGYRCRRAMEPHNPETKDFDVESEEGYVPEGRLQVLKYLLDQKKGALDFYSKAGCLSETAIRRDRSIVEALSGMVRDLEDIDPASEQEEITQPELTMLKNNDQRKEWLANYKSWGLWYRDENINVNYYKYDFIDGSRLIVAEYPQRIQYYSSKSVDEHYYHLLEKNKQGYKKPYDEQYRQQTDSETYLVEFLKDIQKKG